MYAEPQHHVDWVSGLYEIENDRWRDGGYETASYQLQTPTSLQRYTD
jgi:hypothetical protein